MLISPDLLSLLSFFFFNYQRLFLYNIEKHRTKYSYWRTLSTTVLSIHLSLRSFPFPSLPVSLPLWLPLALLVFFASLKGLHTCSVFHWITSSQAMHLTPELSRPHVCTPLLVIPVCLPGSVK